jgi:hypothetical protein
VAAASARGVSGECVGSCFGDKKEEKGSRRMTMMTMDDDYIIIKDVMRMMTMALICRLVSRARAMGWNACGAWRWGRGAPTGGTNPWR